MQAASFGVPQDRVRMILTFALRGLPLPETPSATHSFSQRAFLLSVINLPYTPTDIFIAGNCAIAFDLDVRVLRFFRP